MKGKPTRARTCQKTQECQYTRVLLLRLVYGGAYFDRFRLLCNYRPFELELANGTFILPAKTAVEGSGVSLTVPSGAEVVGVRCKFRKQPVVACGCKTFFGEVACAYRLLPGAPGLRAAERCGTPSDAVHGQRHQINTTAFWRAGTRGGCGCIPMSMNERQGTWRRIT